MRRSIRSARPFARRLARLAHRDAPEAIARAFHAWEETNERPTSPSLRDHVYTIAGSLWIIDAMWSDDAPLPGQVALETETPA